MSETTNQFMCFFLGCVWKWGIRVSSPDGHFCHPHLPSGPPVPSEGSLIAVSVKFHEFANTHLGVQQKAAMRTRTSPLAHWFSCQSSGHFTVCELENHHCL